MVKIKGKLSQGFGRIVGVTAATVAPVTSKVTSTVKNTATHTAQNVKAGAQTGKANKLEKRQIRKLAKAKMEQMQQAGKTATNIDFSVIPGFLHNLVEQAQAVAAEKTTDETTTAS